MGDEIGAIDFRVEDVPYEEDFSKMDRAEKAQAWNDAAGTYGIRDIGTIFDSKDHLLAGATSGAATSLYQRRSTWVIPNCAYRTW